MSAPVPHRDVFICFSKARPGEAKVAFALKDEIEQLGLFAFEYEDWNWVVDGTPDQGPEVDRAILREMLRTSSVVVLISPALRVVTIDSVKQNADQSLWCERPVTLMSKHR